MDNQIFYLGMTDELETKYFSTCLNGMGYVMRNPYNKDNPTVLGTILCIKNNRITYQETVRLVMSSLKYPVQPKIYDEVNKIYRQYVRGILSKGKDFTQCMDCPI